MAVLKKLFALSLVLGSALAAAPAASDFTSADIEGGNALASLNQIASTNTDAITSAKVRRQVGKCTKAKRRVRREWRTLSKPDRKSYIAAVKCLQSKPSILPAGVAPGSKSLFDDFVAIHIQQTLNIHLTGNFLTWHRYFTYTYEQRLRNDCGYKADFPYWEWGLDVNNPAASPVFDGSDTSMGGNGQFFPHPGMIIGDQFNPANSMVLEPGSGGGCVTTGPFGGMTVHLGPAALFEYGNPIPTSAADPLQDNPRCLKRDLNSWIAKKWTTFRNTTETILLNPNIELFQAILQGDTRYIAQSLGIHGGGHFSMGGDPGADPFVSPGDPAFYLHHAQIDRVYWIWQMLDFPNRQGVFGTNTFMDFPPSANTTVDDLIDLGPLAPPVKIKDLMNTVGGSPLCYVYL